MSRAANSQETDDPAREVARAVIARMAKDAMSTKTGYQDDVNRRGAHAFFADDRQLEFWGWLACIDPDTLRAGAERMGV